MDQYQVPADMSVNPEDLSLYARLGVNQDANRDEIIKAYRQQARKYHPDKTLDDKTEEWMKCINEAKEILLNYEQRSEYDDKLTEKGQDFVYREPIGYLPEGFRLSLMFLSIYNTMRISFEADLMKEDFSDFMPLLQQELQQRPIQKPPVILGGQGQDHKPRKHHHTTASLLSDVLSVTKSDLPLHDNGHKKTSRINHNINSSLSLDQLLGILSASKIRGSKSSLPSKPGLVPIINVSNLPDESISLLLSLFVELPTEGILNRNKLLKQFAQFVTYTHAMPCRSLQPEEQNNCAQCGVEFSIFTWVYYRCYFCKKPLCKSCRIKVVLISRVEDEPRPFCSHCLLNFNQRDIEDWTNQSVQFIEAGTLESIKAALGCLTIALCLSNFSTKPVIRVAQALVQNDMPELAMSFVSGLLEHSEDPKETLKIYVLSAQIFKALANQPEHSSETKWDLLLAAKESCNLALETASCLDSSIIELPSLDLASVQQEISDLLNALQEEQELVQESEVEAVHLQMEQLWQKRDWEELIAMVMNGSKDNSSFLPHAEDRATQALKLFLDSKKKFLDKMLPDDRSGLLFLQTVCNIQDEKFSEALTDLHKLAYDSHHHMWLSKAIADLILGLVTNKNTLLFPRDSLNKALEGEHLIGDSEQVDRFSLLFPRNSELTPPFASQWPELGVHGLNTKGHKKFEKAVSKLLDEGRWDEWDAAMAYINYVPGCEHPTEAALCFLYAAMFLLKRLRVRQGSSTTLPLSEVFATKNMIINFLQSSMALCIRFLHPGMQFYVCRLCLGTAMQTMQLTGNLAIGYEARLITTLFHITMYSSRFCPIWHFPSIPLSEAALFSLKSGCYHLKFLMDLQYIEEEKRPVSLAEMHYQIHENDIRGFCPLEDSAGARARAMEDMLREKGWTWNDVVELVTSPLSPRDSEGWLIQQPLLGVSMPYAKLTGCVISTDADSPAIEIVAVPADPANGLVGLFSMDDVQLVLKLADSEDYPILFSLDFPSLHQKLHPFLECRYEPKELHNSLFLQTLFEADYLLKFFSVGAEVSAKPPFESRSCKEGLLKDLPPDLLEAIKPVAEREGRSSQHIHRFWIQADAVECDIRQTGRRMEFDLGEPKMSIRSHPIIPGPDGKCVDTEFEDEPDSPEAKFASDLTSHYSELGKHFPIFARLQELAKLQTLIQIVGNIKIGMKNKAEGKGLEVPEELLTEIQQDAIQFNKDKVDKIVNRLNTDVPVWPTAENQREIDSKAHFIWGRLPAHVKQGASLSNVKPLAKDLLKEEDEQVFNDITELFFEISENKLPKEDLKKSVKQWLSCRDPTSATELKNLVSSAIPLPSAEDVIANLVQPLHKRNYDAFTRKLKSLLPPAIQIPPNPCKWVPTACVKDEDGDLKHYGGVIFLTRLLHRFRRSSCPESDSEPSSCPKSPETTISSVPTLFELTLRSMGESMPVESPDMNATLESIRSTYTTEDFSAPKGPFPVKEPPPQTDENQQDSEQDTRDDRHSTTPNNSEEKSPSNEGASNETSAQKTTPQGASNETTKTTPQGASDETTSTQETSPQGASDETTSTQETSPQGASDETMSTQERTPQGASDETTSTQETSLKGASDETTSTQETTSQKATHEGPSNETKKTSLERESLEGASNETTSAQETSPKGASNKTSNEEPNPPTDHDKVHNSGPRPDSATATTTHDNTTGTVSNDQVNSYCNGPSESTEEDLLKPNIKSTSGASSHEDPSDGMSHSITCDQNLDTGTANENSNIQPSSQSASHALHDSEDEHDHVVDQGTQNNQEHSTSPQQTTDNDTQSICSDTTPSVTVDEVMDDVVGDQDTIGDDGCVSTDESGSSEYESESDSDTDSSDEDQLPEQIVKNNSSTSKYDGGDDAEVTKIDNDVAASNHTHVLESHPSCEDTQEETPDSAVAVKLPQPCALYDQLLHRRTQEKNEELVSIERERRQRIKRLFETFNISHDITTRSERPPTAAAHAPKQKTVNDKIKIRGSSFLSTIHNQQEWISYVAKQHPITAKATTAIKEANRLADANVPCKENECQCCKMMAQSNVCVDSNGRKMYRAELTKPVNCRSSNVVYLIRCRRSGKNVFIGQTKEELHECLDQHRRRQGSTVYQHFTAEGYSFDDLEVMILANIEDEQEREEKEVEWKKKLGKKGR